MTKTNTIHIEPLDEGYVVTHDGKRKAMNSDDLHRWIVSDALELFMAIRDAKSDSLLTFTLITDVPRSA